VAERGLTAGLGAEVVKGLARPVAFVEGEFSSGVARFWSGVGDFSWASKTWTGVGELGKLSPLVESTDVEAVGVELTLSGIPTVWITRVLEEIRQGKPLKVWIGGRDAAGAIVADPYRQLDGRMDAGSIEFGLETSAIKVQAESRRRDLKRAPGLKYDHNDQQAIFPGDAGFEYVPELQDQNLTSGRGTTPIPSGGGGGGVDPRDGDGLDLSRN
jgi:hypothetical protein